MIIGDLFQHNEKQLAKLFRLSGCRFLSVNYSPSYDQKNILNKFIKFCEQVLQNFNANFAKIIRQREIVLVPLQGEFSAL